MYMGFGEKTSCVNNYCYFYYDLWSMNQSLTWTLLETNPTVDALPNSTFVGCRSRTNLVFFNSTLICFYGGYLLNGFADNNTQNTYVKVGDTWCSSYIPIPAPTPQPTPVPIYCNNTFLINSRCTSNSSVVYNGTLNNENVVDISTFTVVVNNYNQNGTLIVSSGGLLQVIGNATINGNIYIIVSGNTPHLILLVNSTQLNLGNVTITTLNGNSKCTTITASVQTIGNQLYALLSEQSTCGNNNNLIIGISVGVGGGLLLFVILIVVLLLVLHKFDKLPAGILGNRREEADFAHEPHEI